MSKIPTMPDSENKFYNVNLKDKINSAVKGVKDFKLDLDENVNDIKAKVDTFSRKEINFNFFDRISQTIYTNPYHVAKIEFLQYIVFIILIYVYNPFNIKTNYPVFTKLLVIMVAFIYVMLFIFIKDKIDKGEDVDLIKTTEANILSKFLYTIAFFVLMMYVIKGGIWILRNTSIITSLRNMFAFLSVIGVLGIVYLFAKKKIDKAKNTSGRKLSSLIIKFIMYLPCLLVDIVEYAKYEMNLTTKPVLILLGIEAVFISLWTLVPYVFDKVSIIGGLKLLNKPVYLTKEYSIGNFDNLHKKRNDNVDKDLTTIDQMYSDKKNTEIKNALKDPANEYTDPNMPANPILANIYNKIKEVPWIKMNFKIHPQYTDTDQKRFRYKYALSGWFYINPQPPNTRSAYSKYTNIIKYGDKVKVEFNGKLSSLRISGAIASTKNDANVKNENVVIYETTNIIYQKWNNIVVNYDDGFIDVFLNGDLVGSISGVAPYMTFDNVIVGEQKGIQGAICNVIYYDKPLLKSDINLNYKTLREKKVPYIWSLTDDNEINIEKNTNPNNSFLKDVKFLFGVN